MQVNGVMGDGEMGVQWSAMTNEVRKRRKEKEGNKECAKMSMEEPWLFVGGSEKTEGILPWAQCQLGQNEENERITYNTTQQDKTT